MYSFLFLFLKTSSVVIRILNQSSIGQSNGFSYISIFFFLLYLLHCVFFPLCLHFPSLVFVFIFQFFLILFLFHYRFLFLHNISWITLTSSHFHFREGSSSHKKLAFPCIFFLFDPLFSCFFDSLFSCFSIHCFPSVFSSFSTGINIQFGLLTSWMFFLHIEYNSKNRDIIRLFLIRDIIRLLILLLILPFVLLLVLPLVLLLVLLLILLLVLLLILWSFGPVCCLSVLYILVFARMSMMS